MEMKSSDRNNNFKNIIIKHSAENERNESKSKENKIKYIKEEKINYIALYNNDNISNKNSDKRISANNNNDNNSEDNSNNNNANNANKKERKSYIIESLNKLKDNDNDYYNKYRQILDKKQIDRYEKEKNNILPNLKIDLKTPQLKNQGNYNYINRNEQPLNGNNNPNVLNLNLNLNINNNIVNNIENTTQKRAISAKIDNRMKKDYNEINKSK